ncbi:MAG: ABC transporter ATP-binding protein/permease [Parcubacteria group bacterium]|nr:ABC transporter ATP-binding protein/permease [Parcubacteria group bacterium]MCR4342319.1 ABC transporter ATP-binding protein/permease [Patescibacteria group bacterium]
MTENKKRTKNNKKFYAGFIVTLRYLAEYKNDIILLSVLGVISALANGAVPYLVGRLFDAIISPGVIFVGTSIEMPFWLFFVIIWGIAQFIANFVDWRSGIRSNEISTNMHSGYVIKGFNRLLELPMSFHKEHKVGEVGEKINRAANAFFDMTYSVIITLAPQFLSIFIAFAIALYLNYILAGVMFFGVVAYVVVMLNAAPPIAVLSRKMNKTYGRVYGDSYDAIFNAQAIKQATAENYEQRNITNRFKNQAGRLYINMMRGWQGLTFYQRVIVMFTQLTVFVLSTAFIQNGSMTIGELVMFNGYAMMFFGPFVVLGNNWQVVQNGLTAIEQAEKILSTPAENYEPENAVILDDIKGEVEFKDVYFSYDKKGKYVLNDINIKVNPGEVVALVGESGVGKSTLIDLISGYHFADKGKVLIDGHNVKQFNLKFLRSKIGVVPQEVVLFNEAIKVNIKYGSFGASLRDVKRAAEDAHCTSFIEKFPKKWDQVVGERGVKLSVGQKQRVAIARAILRDPKILILDEPTSALDAKSEKIIQESLERLMKGKTTFIIAHRLSTVRKADKIIVFEKGRIVEMGKHDELIKKENGVYRNLHEFQVGLND